MKIGLLIDGLNRRNVAALTVFLAFLLSVPLWSTSYVLSVATLVLYLSLLGQPWNLMLGYAGLLSLGHAMFDEMQDLLQRVISGMSVTESEIAELILNEISESFFYRLSR